MRYTLHKSVAIYSSNRLSIIQQYNILYVYLNLNNNLVGHLHNFYNNIDFIKAFAANQKIFIIVTLYVTLLRCNVTKYSTSVFRSAGNIS